MKALQLGAYDFLAKPVDLEDLLNILTELQRSVIGQAQPRTEQPLMKMAELGHNHLRCYQCPKADSCNQVEGVGWMGVFSSQMKKALRYASILHKERSLPVLIAGKSGTGKDLVARYTHRAETLAIRLLLPLIALLSLHICLKASFSATNPTPLPVPPREERRGW